MREVISMVGRRAGSLVWMDDPEAQAALATGAAIDPESPKGMSILGVDHPDAEEIEEQAKEDGNRVDLRPVHVDGKMTFEGDWPKRASIPPRMLVSNMVSMNEIGDVHINFGGRRALYKAIRIPKGGEIAVDFVREILDEDAKAPEVVLEDGQSEDNGQDDNPETVVDPADVVIPGDWEDMHWKHRVKLAADLGTKVETADEADTVILTAMLERMDGEGE